MGTYGVDLRPNSDGLSMTLGSLAINGGISLGTAYSGSINSVPRPQETAFDIGAYEYRGGVMTTPLKAPTNLRMIP